MKYFYILLIAFIFVGCEQLETDEERDARLASEALASKHITYGGDGSINSPFIVGNGTYGFDDTNETYYKMNLNGDCNVLLYNNQTLLHSFIVYNSDYSSHDINSTDLSSDDNQFKLYKNLIDASYTIKAQSLNTSYYVTNSRLGVFGTCLNDVYSYSPLSLVKGLNNHTASNSLYKFDVNSSTNVKINEVQGIENFYIFDDNLTLLHSVDSASFNQVLSVGTYYLLMGGITTNTQSTFYFEIVE